MSRLKFGICPTEGGHFFREALAEVELAEALGLDSVWLAEHHGVRDHYWPAPVQMLTALAARTSRVQLGANVCVFPFYHPVRLAEDGAARRRLERPGGAGRRHRLQARRVPPLRRGPREARRALRGGPRPDEGPLDAGRRDAPGRALHGGGGADRAQARPAAAPRSGSAAGATSRSGARRCSPMPGYRAPRRTSGGSSRARPRSGSTVDAPGSPSPPNGR